MNSEKKYLINSSLADDDHTRRSVCGRCRSRSDCTFCAVWSQIYTVHVFILDCNRTVSLSCSGSVFLANEKLGFIYSVVKELLHHIRWMVVVWTVGVVECRLSFSACVIENSKSFTCGETSFFYWKWLIGNGEKVSILLRKILLWLEMVKKF